MTGQIAIAGTALTKLETPGVYELGFNTDSKTEALGVQDFEGVEAEGTRTITTIPAGAIGNERPIDIIYERWYSKDLQMIISSRHSDPRFGDQTYKLTNIIRANPDGTLFTLPADFKMLAEPGSGLKMTLPALPSTPMPVVGFPGRHRAEALDQTGRAACADNKTGHAAAGAQAGQAGCIKRNKPPGKSVYRFGRRKSSFTRRYQT